MQNDIDVAGLRVLITGGAKGIGRVMAEAFSRAGARVYACDIAAEPLADLAHAMPSVATGIADIADRGAVDRLFVDVAERLGGLDVLVNNAGIAGPLGRVDELDPDEWQRVFDVNVNGAFLCTRRAVPLMRTAGGGSIINIASAAGRIPYALRSPYSTSKFALVGFTQCLALELGPLNIRANAILPGIVRGERRLGNSKRRAAAEGISVDEVEARSLAKVALGRMIEPEEIAAVARFLASKLGANITGQSISVDGYLQTLTDVPRQS
ncbi:MAG: SDR family oxidoreductase [Burkholderiales bacterium]